MKQYFRHLHRGTKLAVFVLGWLTLLILVISVAYSAAYWNKILPGVKILQIEVGNKTGEEAAKLVEERLKNTDWLIEIKYKDLIWKKKATELGLSWDIPQTVNQAWLTGRQGNLWERIGQAWRCFTGEKNYFLTIKYDGDNFENFINEVAEKIDSPLVMPSLEVSTKAGKRTISVVPAKDGLKTDQDWLSREIVGRAQSLDSGTIEVQVRRLMVEMEEEKAEAAKKRAENIYNRRYIFKLENDEWEWDGDQLISLISVVGGGNFDEAEIIKAVEGLAKAINRNPQNAIFQFDNGRVSVFKPGKDGVTVVENRLVESVISTSQQINEQTEVVIEVPVKRIPPITTTEDVNNMGIKELLGRGKSSYSHSIANRVHNVALASSRINGVIVPPGAEFSFNDSVGDISAATGYKSAYIISGGRTVLGDGGGVCQVSTTVFRAALAAGLPIVERKAHAYRVSYYEEDSLPGIDATVFSPTADLKFKNDTPAYLLIQTSADSVNRKLTIDIYGTSDGRKATMTKPRVWGQTPPPPTIYQDDPTLSSGVTKQVDWAASGAKTSFDYLVERDGQEIYSKTFYSNYQPWQAVFLRGTAQ